jgi:D-amino peptidase
VPVVLVTGDAGLCEEVGTQNPHILTVPVKHGTGNSTSSIHPYMAVERIREGAKKALEGDLSRCLLKLPSQFAVEIMFKDHSKAYHSSFYPGAGLKEPHVVMFETDDYFEVMRLLAFVI